MRGDDYHIVISGGKFASERDYINPHSLSARRFGINNSSEIYSDVLIWNDDESFWREVERVPVYVLTYLDGTIEGNPYYKDSIVEVSGDFSPGSEGKSVGQLIYPKGLVGRTIEDIVSAGFYVRRKENSRDNLYMSICDLNGNYLVKDVVVANNSLDTENFVRVTARFDPIDLKENRRYLIYLTSPASGSGGYEIKACRSYTTDSWPVLTYGGTGSVLLISRTSGRVTVDDELIGLNGFIFEKRKNEDLSFIFGLGSSTRRGMYTSPVLDVSGDLNINSKLGWEKLYCDFDVYENTSLTVETRSGNSSDIDSSWSQWEKVSRSDVISSPDSKYIQYRIKIHVRENAISPIIRKVSFELLDVQRPSIKDISPIDGEILTDSCPEIQATVFDDFSGVKPEKVRMWINDKEVLPEYDKVTGEVRYNLFRSQMGENVRVKLKVTDRAGNRLVKRWNFKINEAASVYRLTERFFLEGENENIKYNPNSKDILLAIFSENYVPNGYYVSPILDAGTQVKWGPFWLRKTVPPATSLSIKYRYSEDNILWSEWKSLDTESSFLGVNSRYLQYKLEFSTLETQKSPEIHELGFSACDIQPPTIKPKSPEPGSYINSSKGSFSSIIKDDLTGLDISSFSLYLDGREIDNFRYRKENSIFHFKFNKHLSDGLHEISVFAEDIAGNSSKDSWSFTLDSVGARIELEFPPNNYETSNDRVSVRGIVDDPNAKLMVNGSQVNLNGNQFESKVDLLKENNMIYISAIDRAGNVSTESVSVKHVNPLWIFTHLKSLVCIISSLFLGLFLSFIFDLSGFYSILNF